VIALTDIAHLVAGRAAATLASRAVADYPVVPAARPGEGPAFGERGLGKKLEQRATVAQLLTDSPKLASPRGRLLLSRLTGHEAITAARLAGLVEGEAGAAARLGRAAVLSEGESRGRGDTFRLSDLGLAIPPPPTTR
jgi:hypothetical protein